MQTIGKKSAKNRKNGRKISKKCKNSSCSTKNVKDQGKKRAISTKDWTIRKRKRRVKANFKPVPSTVGSSSS